MAQLTQKMHNIEKARKNAEKALTSHYANGDDDTCDKWVKRQFHTYTANHVQCALF